MASDLKSWVRVINRLHYIYVYTGHHHAYQEHVAIKWGKSNKKRTSMSHAVRKGTHHLQTKASRCMYRVLTITSTDKKGRDELPCPLDCTDNTCLDVHHTTYRTVLEPNLWVSLLQKTRKATAPSLHVMSQNKCDAVSYYKCSETSPHVRSCPS